MIGGAHWVPQQVGCYSVLGQAYPTTASLNNLCDLCASKSFGVHTVPIGFVPRACVAQLVVSLLLFPFFLALLWLVLSSFSIAFLCMVFACVYFAFVDLNSFAKHGSLLCYVFFDALGCVWDRIGQMTRRSIPQRSYTGFNLIPVSGVGEAVGGASEAVSGEKIGGNGVEGTFSNDMTCGEMTFGHTHKQIVKPLSHTCTHAWRAQACATRIKCACVRTVKCYMYIVLSLSPFLFVLDCMCGVLCCDVPFFCVFVFAVCCHVMFVVSLSVLS